MMPSIGGGLSTGGGGISGGTQASSTGPFSANGNGAGGITFNNAPVNDNKSLYVTLAVFALVVIVWIKSK
ncbi:hypothetical protein [Vibrio sp. SCSIO 43137]|uniref:hypothetical protein n=1 Tax=Vibrio sp. SCSIO 43137 TaxID=3021011 RepID=UPI002306F379|nr:hypothetical protein [Vibrio sp. SCSIO 43137]WCE30105.1 hypothetical protein PK654_02065 [Vibrio sp. SCSIO 43137]